MILKQKKEEKKKDIKIFRNLFLNFLILFLFNVCSQTKNMSDAQNEALLLIYGKTRFYPYEDKTLSQILMPLDGVTKSKDYLPSQTPLPYFSRGAYNIGAEKDIKVDYIPRSRLIDDETSYLSYKVKLSKGSKSRVVTIIYPGGLATASEVFQGESGKPITAEDIKDFDSITATRKILPTQSPKPSFSSTAYKIKGVSGITISFVSGSLVQNDDTGLLSYKARLVRTPKKSTENKESYSDIVNLSIESGKNSEDQQPEERIIEVTYKAGSFNDNQNFLNSLSQSDIEPFDGITRSRNILPYQAVDPSFPNVLYEIQKTSSVEVQYQSGSRVNNDDTGAYSYQIYLSRGKGARSLRIEYAAGSFNDNFTTIASITQTMIKNLDGVTPNTAKLPSHIAKPTFDPNPYTLKLPSTTKDVNDISIGFRAGSRTDDDDSGLLFYEVSLERGKAKRVLSVLYDGTPAPFKTNATALTEITQADIKLLDHVAADITTFPTDVADPRFPSGPYTIKSYNNINITYDNANRVNNDDSGALHYKVTLTRGAASRTLTAFYLGGSFKDNTTALGNIIESDVQAVDNITARLTVFPTEQANPNFPNASYTLNSITKVKVSLNAGTRVNDDDKGSLVYEVTLQRDSTTKSLVINYGAGSFRDNETALAEITENHIKNIDNLSADTTVFPEDASDPSFPSNPYTIPAANQITKVQVTYQAATRSNDDDDGTLSYDVKLQRGSKVVDLKVQYAAKSFRDNETALKEITENYIKNIDNLSADTNVLPTEASDPNFPSNPYTIPVTDQITKVQVAYQAATRSNDDDNGALSYSVKLQRGSKVVDLAVKYPNGSFKDNPTVLSEITENHIKTVDGITAKNTVFASTKADPNFSGSPYTLNGIQKVGVAFKVSSRSDKDDDGSLEYQVDLSRGSAERSLKVTYAAKSFLDNETALKSITQSHIKSRDGITAKKTIKASKASNPSFSSSEYTIGSITKLKIAYKSGSRSNNDTKGSLSYKVNLERGTKTRTLQVSYAAGSFSSYKLLKTRHSGSITALDFTPDGNKIVTGTDKGEIKIHKVSDGSLIKNIATLKESVVDEFSSSTEDMPFSIKSIDISPDGYKIAIGTKTLCTYYGHSGSCNSNKVIVKVSSISGIVRVTLELKNQRLLRNDIASSVSFSPNSKYLLAVYSNYMASIYKIRDLSSTSSFDSTIKEIYGQHGDSNKRQQGGMNVGIFDENNVIYIGSYEYYMDSLTGMMRRNKEKKEDGKLRKWKFNMGDTSTKDSTSPWSGLDTAPVAKKNPITAITKNSTKIFWGDNKGKVYSKHPWYSPSSSSHHKGNKIISIDQAHEHLVSTSSRRAVIQETDLDVVKTITGLGSAPVAAISPGSNKKIAISDGKSVRIYDKLW